jgi:hypothetical protein
VAITTAGPRTLIAFNGTAKQYATAEHWEFHPDRAGVRCGTKVCLTICGGLRSQGVLSE